MKKDLIFAPILLLIAAALFLLKLTDLPVHIALSVVGAAVLAVYSALTRKEWKIVPLEVVMRVLYGIALITGILVMNVVGLLAVSVIHKVSAVLFVAALIAVVASKAFAEKKA